MAYFSSEDDPVRAPYGTWRSPLSAELVAQGATPLSQPRIGIGADGAASAFYCLQARASDGGRTRLLRWDATNLGAEPVECTPAPFNVRTRVHEYGGGAYLVSEQGIAFSSFSDDRLYWIAGAQAAPAPLTATPGARYADFVLDAARARLIAVRELHAGDGSEAVNCLCAVALPSEQATRAPGDTVLAQGHDFYAAPRLSPDGSQLAWLAWDHPRMPWEGCELWVAAVQEDGSLGTPEHVAGGPTESICQPSWSPDCMLYFVSDRSGWWNLHRRKDQPGNPVSPVYPTISAEFGVPHWSFGQSRYAFNGPNEIICAYIDMGVSHLARLNLNAGTLEALPGRQLAHYTDIQDVRVANGRALIIGGSPHTPLELACIELGDGAVTVLARSVAERPDAGYVSIPESIDYPSGGRTAHAFFYRPVNRDYVGNTRALPPLIVISHGGPTGMASSTFNLTTQYWTSRGFAVLDVNYGGSSGFGRAYRHAIRGKWGIVDVEDCVNGARFLAEHNMVDGSRLIIRGGSAGGFTTLCALAFHDVFKAGAIYYGVSDLKAIDSDSHKFESHYNTYLIGPAEKAEALYLQRSPIHHADSLQRPMIFFQGEDDKVVPPAQSEVMVEALKTRGVPVAYLSFAGEGHGFRQAATIVRTLEAELYFYARVLGLPLRNTAEPVPIFNLHDDGL